MSLPVPLSINPKPFSVKRLIVPSAIVTSEAPCLPRIAGPVEHVGQETTITGQARERAGFAEPAAGARAQGTGPLSQGGGVMRCCTYSTKLFTFAETWRADG